MVRRSSPQSKIDDLAFAVRVKIYVPENGLGVTLTDIHDWLRTEIGRDGYAVHAGHALAMDAAAVYFRDTRDAHRFALAFPHVDLADEVESVVYTAPGRPVDNLREGDSVCTVYSMTAAQAAIRDLARAAQDSTGNLAPLPAIFPDQSAPVVRNGEGSRELTMMRWGMSSPPAAMKGKRADPGVTNIRNLGSPHWRRWLGPDHRCVVPVTSFSEYEKQADGSRSPVWFALSEDRPLAFFAGLWTRWTSVRKVKEGETTNDLFGFLTTEANAEVAAIHPKAMPVLLTTAEDVATWLEAPAEEALALQRPLRDDALSIVARGAMADEAAMP